MNRTASCYCGQVEVSVRGEPVFRWACHCDNCQRMSGSIGQFFAAYSEDCIVAVTGETHVFGVFPDAPGAGRHFCKTCGTTVYARNPEAMPGITTIAVGCFADPEFPGPQTVSFTRYRHAWCGEFEGARSFEGNVGEDT